MVAQINATDKRPDFFEVRQFGKNEDGRFLRFLNIVEESAARQGRIFFVDAAEGHDFIGESIDCCDLSGWLIAPEDVEVFEGPWRDDTEEFQDMFTDEMCMAIWSGDPFRPETIVVSFEML